MDKFICVGKNYIDHAKELGDQVPEHPVLFLKPPSAGVFINSHETCKVHIPKNRGPVHFECEIILLLNDHAQIVAVSLGLDMTLRDLQVSLKRQGHPWEAAKVFKDAAVVGPWIPLADFPDYLQEPFSFHLDGILRQNAHGSGMRSSPQACIEYAQRLFPILDGDIMFTGTPAGVGPVAPGQKGELRWGNRLKYEVLFE